MPHGMAPGYADVLEFDVDLAQDLGFGAAYAVAGVGHVSQEVPAVRDSAAFGVAALFELGLRELLHQRMQQTARAFLAQQRLVRQRRQHGQCNATDGARRLRA